MVNIRKVACPKDKMSIKCPYSMNPTGIVIHNTYNSASADDEIAYMHRNSNKVSFHLAVDEKEAVQGVEFNRNTWNAGDGGTGKGNREKIAIEICRSCAFKTVNGKKVADEALWEKNYRVKFEQAQENAAELTAYLLKMYGWGIEKVTKHQDYSGKYCPHRTLDDYGWDYFLKLVKKYLDKDEPEKETATTKPVTKPTTTVKDKDKLSLKNVPLYASSTAKKESSKKTGTYYLWSNEVVNGRVRITNSKANIGKAGQVTGWVNASDVGIKDVDSSPVITKGQKVVLKNVSLYASSSATKASGKKTGTYYLWSADVVNKRIRITNKASNVGKSGQVTGWVNVSDID